MPGDERKREPLDRSRIHLSKDQTRYWTDKLGVSKAQLEGVIREVGFSADAVEAQLRRMALYSGEKR
ncbi:DUF3606 domain-containing protein [Bosea sp. MMO-172]|uniref:DUF3606 domain-containing protein n=1 Tax=Bosea sp. MMO-172 TaxID=3127885 RepID=UPI00301B60D0